MEASYAWNSDFPKGYGHTSIAYLKRCSGYEQAKTGDHNAAKSVVRQCIKRDRIDMIRRLYPSAVLLPVITDNKLPLALSEAVGLPVYTAVKKVCRSKRKNLCAMERFMYKPVFKGAVPSGIEFIIVDDVVTQGGTVSALRNYIMSYGSFVVAVIALAYAIGSTIIAPKEENIKNLINKFGNELKLLLCERNNANDFREMTNSQIRYLLRFKCLENILLRMNLITKVRQAA